MKGKRILICCNRTLNLGGIEKALTTFLRAFNTNENEVLLVLHNSDGVLHAELPLDKIKVFYTNTISSSALLKEDIRKLRLGEVVKGIWNRILLRKETDWYAQIMHAYRILERKLVFPGHFDCAISFTSDYSDLAMVVAADADKRVSFVHGDATQGPRAARLNDHLLRKIDKIYSVSERAKELFLQMHPACAPSADVMHNVLLCDEIRAKAEQSAEGMLLDGKLTLCTVGRLSEEKGQQMVPAAARILRDAGYDFRWYLIGDGGIRTQLEAEIEKEGLADCVILLGARANPYPYMKNCDVYVQTSFSEAYCTTTVEAKILCKTIVTTDAPGMREQFVSGENGLIVDAMTPEAIAEGVRTLLDNPELMEKFRTALQSESHDNTSELQKLYDLIEE